MSGTGFGSRTSEFIAGTEPDDVYISGNYMVANHPVICLCCRNEFSSQMTKICPYCGYPALSMGKNIKEIRFAVERFRQKNRVAIRTMEKKAGSLLEFGNYKGERILWRVLEIENGKAFLLSEKGLDFLPYHRIDEDISWEESDIRKWLNTTFYQNAFSHEEKQVVLRTGNMDNGGTITEDLVFLLSVEEIYEYLNSSLIRRCYPAESAVSQEIESEYSGGCCRWWLRSISRYPGKAESITARGTLGVTERDKQAVSAKRTAVRPAIWIQV